MAAPGAEDFGAVTPDAEVTDLLDTGEAGAKAIRGGAIRVAGFGAIVLLSVGSSAILFRHLGVADAGHYLTILSLVTLAGGLTDAGLSGIGVRELATRDRQGRAELMRSLIGLRMALSLLGVCVAVAFAAIVGYSSTLVLGTVIAGAGIVLMVLQDTYAVPLIASLRLGWVTAADVLRQLVTVVAIMALVLAGAGLLPFWSTSIAGGLASCALTGWLVHRSLPLLPSLRVAQWRALLRDTLPYALATAVTAAYFRVGILIVSLVASAEQTGYFAVSFRVIEVLIIVPQLVIGASFPIFARAARDDHERLSYAVGKMFDTSLILGVGAALGLVVGAPFIIRVVGGPQFTQAEGVLRIQAIALLLAFIGALWGYALLSLHRHREILVVSLVALVVTLSLTTVLASTDGADGAAIGTTVSEAVFTSMLGLAVYRTGIRPAIHWSAVPRVVVAAALLALLMQVVGLPSSVALVLSLALYACALVALHCVPREILDEVSRLARRSG